MEQHYNLNYWNQRVNTTNYARVSRDIKVILSTFSPVLLSHIPLILIQRIQLGYPWRSSEHVWFVGCGFQFLHFVINQPALDTEDGIKEESPYGLFSHL